MSRVLAAAFLALATSVFGQSADEWAFRGDFHAERSEHAQAAAAYERALLDPGIRQRLLPKLARQLLWSGDADRAASLLGEHLRTQPDECDARNDYGLALAWSDALSDALRQFQQVIEECPAIRNAARLRAAMAARWQDRPSLAARHYREVTAEGTAAEQAEARVGLAHVLLMTGYERGAHQEFVALARDGDVPAANEGAAIASVRLGDYEDATRRLIAAGARGPLSVDLQGLQDHLRDADRLEVRPRTIGFRDGDGTTFSAAELEVSRGWNTGTRAGLQAGRSRLFDAQRSESASWLELRAEHRDSRAVGARAAIRRSSFEEADWAPFTGELHAVWTPNDTVRVDAIAGRLIITDHLGAISARITGDIASIGADFRLTPADTIVGHVDATWWSEGNRRTRAIASWRHRFEGVPRVTAEWPTLLQIYDRPFSFGLFSPRRYIETGPALNLYRRFARVWNASVYVRAGVQREDDADWRTLGTARAAIERDLRDRWAFRAAAGWSNSNVTGSGGFRRSSLVLEVARRF